MAKSPIGCCGLHCASCDIYIASTSSDDSRKADLAVKYSQIKGKKLSAEDMHCWGCWSNSRNCWGRRCEFRKCANDKGIDFCYQCREFPCQNLLLYYSDHVQARENLTQISKLGFEAYITELIDGGSENE